MIKPKSNQYSGFNCFQRIFNRFHQDLYIFFWIHGQYISNFSMKLFVIQLGFAGKCEEDNWVNSSRFL